MEEDDDDVIDDDDDGDVDEKKKVHFSLMLFFKLKFRFAEGKEPSSRQGQEGSQSCWISRSF